jgi:hypothetical protein
MRQNPIYRIDEELGLSGLVTELFELPFYFFNRATNEKVIDYLNQILQDECKKLRITNCKRVLGAYYNSYRNIDGIYDVLIRCDTVSKINGRNTLRHELIHIADKENNRQSYELRANIYELKEFLKDLILLRL